LPQACWPDWVQAVSAPEEFPRRPNAVVPPPTECGPVTDDPAATDFEGGCSVGQGSGPRERAAEIGAGGGLVRRRNELRIGEIGKSRGDQYAVEAHPGAVVVEAVAGVGRAVREPGLEALGVGQICGAGFALAHGVAGGEGGLAVRAVPAAEVAVAVSSRDEGEPPPPGACRQRVTDSGLEAEERPLEIAGRLARARPTVGPEVAAAHSAEDRIRRRGPVVAVGTLGGAVRVGGGPDTRGGCGERAVFVEAQRIVDRAGRRQQRRDLLAEGEAVGPNPGTGGHRQLGLAAIARPLSSKAVDPAIGVVRRRGEPGAESARGLQRGGMRLADRVAGGDPGLAARVGPAGEVSVAGGRGDERPARRGVRGRGVGEAQEGDCERGEAHGRAPCNRGVGGFRREPFARARGRSKSGSGQ